MIPEPGETCTRPVPPGGPACGKPATGGEDVEIAGDVMRLRWCAEHDLDAIRRTADDPGMSQRREAP